MKNTVVLVLSLTLAGGTLAAQETTIKPLLSKDLVGTPGKELDRYANPGSASSFAPLLNPTIGFGCAQNVRSMTAKRSRKRVASVREHVASKPKESRASLEAVRRAILKALPMRKKGWPTRCRPTR